MLVYVGLCVEIVCCAFGAADMTLSFMACVAGAVGDGSTDDTPAFEKAAASDFTGVLYIPAGTYV